jgi:hypothetical protein
MQKRWNRKARLNKQQISKQTSLMVQSQDEIAKQVALFRRSRPWTWSPVRNMPSAQMLTCCKTMWTQRTNQRTLRTATRPCTSTQVEQAGPPGMREARSRGPEEIFKPGGRGSTWAVWVFDRMPVTRVVKQTIFFWAAFRL